MSWRPWMVVFALIVSLLGSAALMSQEVIPSLEIKEEVSLQNEPLRQLNYVPTARINNFVEMGMDDTMAKDTADLVVKLQVHRQRYMKMLDEQALQIGESFCPTPSGLPQPYAAMRWLVRQEGGRRDVIDAHNQLATFEEQAWFQKEGLALPVYNVLERSARRKADATLMGVSAVLLGREGEAVNERGPWSNGVFGNITSGFGALQSDNPRITRLASEYFAIVHYLTELANEQDGICS